MKRVKVCRHKQQPQPQSKCISSYNCIIDTPIGNLGIKLIDDRIAKIDLLSPKFSLIAPKNIVERHIIAKIKRYFCNPRCKFDLPMNIGGTLLQKKIWRALQKIPAGKVKTYGELAKIVKTNPRVIGNACRLNPLLIIIPCHRVIAANGLGGYCGKKSRNIKIKKWLLTHENKNSIV